MNSINVDAMKNFNTEIPLDKNDIIKVCEGLLNDNIFLGENFEVINAANDDYWTINLSKERGWQFRLNSFIWCEYLADGYIATAKKEYLEKAKKLILNWYQQNIINSKTTEMTWHDHSTALRLIRIIRILSLGEINNDEKDNILDLINKHCEKLSDDEFYTFRHNHGLDQDIALYIGADYIEDIAQKKYFKIKVKERFWQQIDTLFLEDGSYSEHSLAYSWMCTYRLMNFKQYLSEVEDNSFEKLNQIIQEQIKFLVYMSLPNGELPPLGDGGYQNINEMYSNISRCYKESLDYTLEKNDVNVQLENGSKVFSRGGYAVLRNKWELDEKTVQLIWTSAFHTRVHKHHDDLSIQLFAHQTPVLIDSGKYNYNYDDELRKYVVSGLAHNSVYIDNKDTNISRVNVGKSGITNYSLNKEIDIIVGTHCLYEGINHTRIVIYLKDTNFLILDHIEGYKEHSCKQVFNFNPDIECFFEEGGLIAKTKEGNRVSFEQLMNQEDITSKLAKGSKEPLLGWSSPKDKVILSNNHVEYEQLGQEIKYATEIILENDKIKNFEWTQEKVTFHFQEKEYVLIMGKEILYCLVNNKILPMNNVISSIQKQAIDNTKNYSLLNKIKILTKENIKLKQNLEKVIGTIDIKEISCLSEMPTKVNQTSRWNCIAEGKELEYAWYIYMNDEVVKKQMYSTSNILELNLQKPGIYYLKVFVRNEYELKKTCTTDRFIIGD